MRNGGNGSVQSGLSWASKVLVIMKPVASAPARSTNTLRHAFRIFVSSCSIRTTGMRFPLEAEHTPRAGSNLGVGRRLKYDVGDGRDVIAILWIGGESLPLRVLAERSPRGIPRRHVGEGEHVSEAGHIRADERLAEEDWREARSPKDRHLAGVEHLQLVECSAIAVTLVRPELEDVRCSR